MDVVRVVETPEYSRWLLRLRDRRARAHILARTQRLSLGNAGDVRSLGGGLYEMRVDHGPGYRVYFTRRGLKLVLLLVGGDKHSQSRDIDTARKLNERL